MAGKRTIDNIAMWLVLVGALNWLFVAFDSNILTMISLGAGALKTAYWAIGLSAAWQLARKFRLL